MPTDVNVTSGASSLSQDWFGDLWNELSDPAWAAGILETLLGAGVALAGALVLLRRQLTHDRELSRQQRLAEAASAYGRQLLNAHEVLNNLNSYELGEALRAQETPPGAREMYDAVGSAEVVLGDHEVIYDLWWERIHLWRQWRQALKSMNLQGADAKEADAVLGSSVVNMLHPNNEALRMIGTALVRWDGVGQLPGAESLSEGFTPVPHPRRANRYAYDEWCKREREEFKSDVTERLHKRRRDRENLKTRSGQSPAQ